MSSSIDQNPVDLSRSINEKLADLSKTSNNQFIFKVHQKLRKQNEEAYEPEMLSIGPYHHGKENLKKMEKYKLKYLQGILERRGEPSSQRYIAALREVEEKARDCYAEYLDCLSPDAFVEMMLLDGCFIIEFLRKDNPIFSMGWYEPVLCRDLLLFENQLPFFILELLFNMTKIEGREEDLIHLTISCLYDSIPSDNSIQPSYTNIRQPFHILMLMHESWCPSFAEAMDAQGEGGRQRCFMQFFKWLHSRREQVEAPGHMDTLEEGGHQFFQRLHSRREQVEASGHMDFIKSVRELKQHGIKFRKANQSRSWLDIKFENRTMQIPNLVVQDSTESLLRNLIAYEQYMSDIAGYSRMVVTDYATFIDCLINSSEDVQWLCDKKIITNWLGSDEEISKMFNKIGNNVMFDPEQFSYRKLFKDVNEHCSRRRHAWIADLKKKYFHNPWSIISFLAAIFLLLLALIQTVIALLQVAKETKID